VHGLIGAVLENSRPVEPVPTLPERIEQRGPEALVIERVVVVAERRLGPLAVALDAGSVEAVD
jgi:hypothetical protein